jgi:hypothetical protein
VPAAEPYAYTFATGERLQFVRGSTALKFWGRPGANATTAPLLGLKLSALSELDGFGQPLATHTIPDLSAIQPDISTGHRVSGNAAFDGETPQLQQPGVAHWH